MLLSSSSANTAQKLLSNSTPGTPPHGSPRPAGSEQQEPALTRGPTALTSRALGATTRHQGLTIAACLGAPGKRTTLGYASE